MTGCAGYEPLFSTKKLSFYIDAIDNVNESKITKKISKNLNNNKKEIEGKKNYILKILSGRKNNITSRDSKGVASTYEMVINVKVEVFYNDINTPIATFVINKNSNYKNQINKFSLSQYKNTIEENIIREIAQEITIKLQSL
jgi:outer membrane lipopolysaccharide assembly protein LptE/RlpB|tara:strand:+ start:156 stop:581 length:426 start_codon:yes stop_codon:yes gene_type:complete